MSSMERRRAERIPDNSPVRYHVISGSRRDQYQLKRAANANVSKGGVLLMTRERLQKGDRVELELLLPRPGSDLVQHVIVQGEVMRAPDEPDATGQYPNGIALVGGDERDVNAFVSYVQHAMDRV